MANEVRVNVGVTINAGNVKRNYQESFAADMAGRKGPTPGAVTVATTGTDIDLSGLTTPGICVVKNLDETNYVQVGIHDGGIFHPFLELRAGEAVAVRLARDLMEEQNVAGTGTTGNVNALHARADTAACVVSFEAFEV